MTCEIGDCYKESFKEIITEYSCFGHEYMMLCKEHYLEHIENKRKPQNGYCERCKNPEGENIKPFQDPEEGSSAVYLDTCESCRQSINESFCD